MDDNSTLATKLVFCVGVPTEISEKINGFLVGGASLKPEFADIVAAISISPNHHPNYYPCTYSYGLV